MNKTIHYILKCIKHIGDEDYMEYVLERESDPYRLELSMNVHKKHDNTKLPRIMAIPELGKGSGFFCEFNGVLESLYYADMLGFAPVIYWGEGFLYYDKSFSRDNNSWEYYFEQPCFKMIGNDDVSRVINDTPVVLWASELQASILTRQCNKDFDLNEDFESRMSEMYSKYVRLNQSTYEQIHSDLDSVSVGEHTLGVHYRGTDFKANYDNHPVSVQLEQTKEAIDEAMAEGGFTSIFLATDDVGACEYFKTLYGDSLHVYEDVFRGNSMTSVAFSEDCRENHKYRLGYEVLRDMYTLSECGGLIAGVSQVSITTRIVHRAKGKEWKKVIIINNGKNHNKKEFKS